MGRYKSIEVKPIAGALGAEVLGADLAADLDNETYDDIHQAFLDHIVLLFRGQRMTVEQHLAFGRRFGPLHEHPFVEPMKGQPHVLEIVKEPDEGINPGGRWHSDVSFGHCPPLGSSLHAIELPCKGGDTLFANQYLAYESLSDGMKALLDGLRAVHGTDRYFARASGRYDGKRSVVVDHDKVDAYEPPIHPVVRTHPETGRKALYVNDAFTVRFEDMTVEESRPLLDFLCAHAIRPEFTCRVRWEPYSLVLWDNRCTQHCAINDYPGRRRVMRRVTIAGDRPV